MWTIAGGIVLAVFIFMGIGLGLWVLMALGGSISDALTRSRIPPRDRDIADRIDQLEAIKKAYGAKREAIGYWVHHNLSDISPSFEVSVGHEQEDQALWEEFRKATRLIEDELLDLHAQRGIPLPAFLKMAASWREFEKNLPGAPSQ